MGILEFRVVKNIPWITLHIVTTETISTLPSLNSAFYVCNFLPLILSCASKQLFQILYQ